MYRFGHFFLYNLYIFVLIQHGCLANRILFLDPNNILMKRLTIVLQTGIYPAYANCIDPDQLASEKAI